MVLWTFMMLIVAACSDTHSEFEKIRSTSSARIDPPVGEFYTVYYSIDVENRSDADLYYQVEWLPEDQRLKKIIGERYLVTNGGPSAGAITYRTLAQGKSSFGFTVSIPQKSMSLETLQDIYENYSYRLSDESDSATFQH